MQFFTNEALSDSLVPVLLGCSSKSFQSAHTFHQEYGVLSHLFSGRIPFYFYFSPILKLHKVRATRDEALMLHALLDFAKQLENADRLLYLVPCTAFYRDFVATHKAELEGAFVLCTPEFLSRTPRKEGAR